ncbi:ZIP family metal transporter [Candidatus Woesearchaeota archaeon]|nr:ZIP family metal transporter [Candidatus Woesearchaeota archaeon]
MNLIWLYALGSVFIVSLVSLIGVFLFGFRIEKVKQILIYFVSFAAGALLGDVFIHLLPELVKEHGLTIQISIYILLGILISFIVEKIIHWTHCHHNINNNNCDHALLEQHTHSKKQSNKPLSLMTLFGDSIHNFIDGIIIATSFLVSIPAGIATTIAVIFHEIPQEISDFGVLIHDGFTKTKALLFNFLTALTAVIGVIVTLIIGPKIEGIIIFLTSFAVGSFIYIAASDFIPELHKETDLKVSALQLITFVLGITAMFGLLLLE